jgi:hypothetical protein
MHTYSLVDWATGEEIEVDATTVERITDIEIAYINWVIAQDGLFDNGDWIIR